MARRIALLFFLGCMSVSGCTYIDDYWLGKDNSPIPGLLSPVSDKLTLAPAWTVQLGRASAKEQFLRLKPSLDDGVIYVATHQGMVKAIRAATGQVMWSRQLKARFVSGPEIGEGRLALATHDANVVVLDKKEGKELWRARISGEALAAPLIAEHRVIAKTVDGRLYAFDLATGEKLWVVDHGTSPLVLRASSSPVRYKDLVLAGFADGKLDGVDPATGHVVWQRNLAFARGGSDVERLADITTDPIVKGDTAYLASYQGYILALSLRQGEFLWSKPASTYKNLGIDSSRVYMSDSEDILWAMNRINGQVEWKQDALKARGITEPVQMMGRLIVGDKLGLLHVLDAKHGDFLARHTVGTPIVVGPLVHGRHIYVMTAGQLHCFLVKG